MERRKFKDKIDILPDSGAKEDISYCRHCMINFNQKNVLHERKDYNERDADLWRQCWECWRIYPVYELKYEGKLRGIIERDEHPFSTTPSVVGMENKHKGRADHSKERLRKKIADEHDPDVRELLKQGFEIIEDYEWKFQDDT
jgi:hypothetical protein